MRTEMRSNAAPAAVIALLLVSMVLFAYIVSYYGLPHSRTYELLMWCDDPIAFDEREQSLVVLDRVYPSAWLAQGYRPMAVLEGWWRGILVNTLPPERGCV
jgi:hypothetical protein